MVRINARNFDMHINRMILAVVLLLSCSGCGGGGGTDIRPMPQKTADVTFGTSSNNQTVPLKGVFIAATLPAGLSVATEPGSTQISTTALKGVGDGGQTPFGTYSAAIRKVRISSALTSSSIAYGPYARLICNVTPGTTLKETDITSITPDDFQPTGDGGSDLSSTVKSVISVVFGY